MRIGLVINQLAPGGAEVQVMLARHLRAAGHDVSVVSLLPPAGLAEELSTTTLIPALEIAPLRSRLCLAPNRSRDGYSALFERVARGTAA